MLGRTKQAVKVFAFGSRDHVTLPAAAALILAATGDYEGGGTPRRCRYIRPLTAPPPPPIPFVCGLTPDAWQAGFLRYPTPCGITGYPKFPALARMGAGL